MSPPNLARLVGDLYENHGIDASVSAFSRLLLMLAIYRDIWQYVRILRRRTRRQAAFDVSLSSDWGNVVTSCYQQIQQTPCLEGSWPRIREVISQYYHCIMIMLHIPRVDLDSYFGFQANCSVSEATRSRLALWIREQPDSVQSALRHSIKLFVGIRARHTHNQHESLVLSIAVRVLWIYAELKQGQHHIDLGWCQSCKAEMSNSLKQCCVGAFFSTKELSDTEIGLIKGVVCVDRLVWESYMIINGMSTWKISRGIAEELEICYQKAKRLKSKVDHRD